MKRAILIGFFLGLTGLWVSSCSSSDLDEGVGSNTEGLSKCAGGKLGDSNYCSPSCKCDHGEGDCDTLNDCGVDPVLGQLRCAGKGIYFTGTTNFNACAPLHCDNKKLDAAEGEIVVDCGGPCGTFCPGACDNLPANGANGHCTLACPCAAGHGNCNADNALCQANHVCLPNVGTSFGFAANVDVCVRDHCTNMMLDGDEVDVDCGPSCLPCTGSSTMSFAHGGSNADHGIGVAIDGSSAIVVAGRFGGSASFGGATLTASGGSDIFLARYSNTGKHGWSKRFGGAQADGDLGVAVAVDNGRNIYLGGNYRGTIDFGNGFTHTAVGTNTDAFVVKFNDNGVPLWSRSYGSTSAERVNALTVSPTGIVFVAGSFASPSVDFGGGARTNQGANATYDAFVLRLTSAGAHVYSKAYGSTGADHALGIAIDSSLNAYVAGSFQGTIESMTANGTATDAYVMKLAPSDGATLWATPIGGPAADSASSIALDGTGPVTGGQFKQTVDFGDGMPVTALGANAAFVVAYDASGAFRWKKAFTSAGTDRTTAMAGAAGGVVALGDFQGTVDFGAGAVTATGTRDMFLVRYNTAGTLLHSTTYAGNPTLTPLGATVANGMLGVTGDFQGTINLGGSNLSGGGDDDMFFARFVF